MLLLVAALLASPSGSSRRQWQAVGAATLMAFAWMSHFFLSGCCSLVNAVR